jgi:hypothetical protein
MCNQCNSHTFGVRGALFALLLALSVSSVSASTNGVLPPFDALVPQGTADTLYAPVPDSDVSVHRHESIAPVIGEGESKLILGPHHTEVGSPNHPSGVGDPTHYFAATGDVHHFLWQDQIPATPGIIDVYYDFRAQGGYSNLINPAQQVLAVQAMDFWASVSDLNFIQNTLVSASGIINIGTGDLAALGEISGSGGILGLGGGIYTHTALHTITGGVAWMDSAETWDVTIGNGNPGGTFDWFTVAVQEIGHGIALGHVDDIAGLDMMDGSYSAEQTVLSANDIDHITSIYGVAAVPIPAAVWLFGSGLMGLIGIARRRRA